MCTGNTVGSRQVHIIWCYFSFCVKLWKPGCRALRPSAWPPTKKDDFFRIRSWNPLNGDGCIPVVPPRDRWLIPPSGGEKNSRGPRLAYLWEASFPKQYLPGTGGHACKKVSVQCPPSWEGSLVVSLWLPQPCQRLAVIPRWLAQGFQLPRSGIILPPSPNYVLWPESSRAPLPCGKERRETGWEWARGEGTEFWDQCDWHLAWE